MRELLDHQILRQRREDVLCEVRMNRLAKELWANPERRSAHISTLMWDLERHVGQLLKRSRLWRDNLSEGSKEREHAAHK
jgi:hypothetical protein